MSKFTVLYNPLSGHAEESTLKEELKSVLAGNETDLIDLTSIENLKAFLSGVEPGTNILIAGGDGTLNRFVNDADTEQFRNQIYYYAAGNGNDFWTDLGRKRGDAPICINEYLKNLPQVTVNGKRYKFLNGVGFGIDGYCCEVGDRLKAQNKKVNYTAIAIKGLLMGFHPANATVTVDGVTEHFKKAWIAPAMFGRFYGGGMMPTPAQDRNSESRCVSVCLFYGKGRLKTLMVFPSIFKGEHIKKTNMVAIRTGQEITVRFDRPTALQIDGETITGVTEYTVTCSAAEAKNAA